MPTTAKLYVGGTQIGGNVPATISQAASGTYSSGGKNYKYYQFLGSGTLTVDEAGVADVLVVGGGGGGAKSSTGSYGGGGGAGGYVYGTYLLEAGTYTVVVGAGSAGAISGSIKNGNHSVLGKSGGPVIAAGGGGGGGSESTQTGGGKDGGSGGGGGARNYPGGSGTFPLGNNGAQGQSGGGYGGGGGGAGGPGTTGTTATDAVAGPGVTNSITGSSVLYAKGGNNVAGAATANTGSGGGGTGGGGTIRNGGSGIVVVRVEI